MKKPFFRRCTFIHIGLIALFTLHATLPVGWAQDTSFAARKNIAIVGFSHGVHRDVEENVYETVKKHLQSKEEFQVVDTSTVEVGLRKAMSQKSNELSKTVEQAYEHFAQGVEHYRNLDLTQAIRELNRAVKGYRKGIGNLEDNYYLLYSHLYLGMALYFDGREQEGKKFIYEMVKLDPKRKTRTLPTRDFPPKIVQIHKEQTQRVKDISNGTIHVDSSPSNARVMLDGMDIGETPMTIVDVPEGQHYLSIDQAGHELYKQLIDVKGGDQNIIANLTPRKLFYAKNPFEQEQDVEQTKVLQEMAKDLSIDYFILGQVEPLSKSFEMKLQSYNVMAGSYSSIYGDDLGKKQRKVKGNIQDVVDQWIESVVMAAGGSPSVDYNNDFREPQFEQKTDEKKGFSKKFLWIGLGVIAVGAGGFLLFSGSGDQNANVLNIPNPLNE